MPHPPGRKALTRARILRAARWLFRTRGYQATSIDAVMMACGLTHGGFYLHFRNKAALYREAMDGPALAAPGESDAVYAQCMHAPQLAAESPWAFLAGDVASERPEVREAYRAAVEALRSALAGPGRRGGTHPLGGSPALAATAMLIGTLAIARSVDDPALVAEVARASLAATQALRTAHDDTRDPPVLPDDAQMLHAPRDASVGALFWSLDEADIARSAAISRALLH